MQAWKCSRSQHPTPQLPACAVFFILRAPRPWIALFSARKKTPHCASGPVVAPVIGPHPFCRIAQARPVCHLPSCDLHSLHHQPNLAGIRIVNHHLDDRTATCICRCSLVPSSTLRAPSLEGSLRHHPSSAPPASSLRCASPAPQSCARPSLTAHERDSLSLRP